jgi:hypothetical protein
MQIMRKMRIFIYGVAALAVVPAMAQVRPGPLPPGTNAPPIVSIPTEPKPEPPPIPPAEMIKRFSENEDAMVPVRAVYSDRRTVTVEELDDEGKATGRFLYTTESAAGPDGRMIERAVKHADISLNVLNLEPENLDVLGKIPPLPFTTSQLVHYDVTYFGTQKLDELDTYIFRLKPKQVERQHAYFDGVIWVDAQDFVVVKTSGHWITELGDIDTQNFPFKFFDTYRENVEGKIWFPNYLRSDASITSKRGLTRVRLIVKWENFKPGSKSPAPATQN